MTAKESLSVRDCSMTRIEKGKEAQLEVTRRSPRYSVQACERTLWHMHHQPFVLRIALRLDVVTAVLRASASTTASCSASGGVRTWDSWIYRPRSSVVWRVGNAPHLCTCGYVDRWTCDMWTCGHSLDPEKWAIVALWHTVPGRRASFSFFLRPHLTTRPHNSAAEFSLPHTCHSLHPSPWLTVKPWELSS